MRVLAVGIVAGDMVLANHRNPLLLFSDSLGSFREAEEPNKEDHDGCSSNASDDSSSNGSRGGSSGGFSVVVVGVGDV